MSDYGWTEDDHERAADRLRAALLDLPAWYYEGFGECPEPTEDGVCGYSLDEQGRCWVRSRHAEGVASPDTDMLG